MKKPNIITARRSWLLVVTAALMSLLCPSCAKEAAKEEPAPLHITLTLPGDDAQQYGNIDLLAFDREGYFAGCWRQCGSQVQVSLDKGCYTLIACSWIGNEFVLSPENMVEKQTALGGVTIRPCADGAAFYMGAAKDVIFGGTDGQNLTISLTRNDKNLATGVELVVWGIIQGTGIEM